MKLPIQALDQRVGLSGAQALAQLQRDGPNELPSAKPRTILAIAWEVVRQPMFLQLVGCALICLALGELQDALCCSSWW